MTIAIVALLSLLTGCVIVAIIQLGILLSRLTDLKAQVGVQPALLQEIAINVKNIALGSHTQCILLEEIAPRHA